MIASSLGQHQKALRGRTVRNGGKLREVAVVTGAGQGIGRAICERLARDKRFALAMIERSAQGEKTASEIRSQGAEVLYIQCDVSDETQVCSAAEEVANFGAVRCVVNNAGIYPRAKALEMDFSDWLEVIKVNLGGTFLVSRSFAPLMLEAGEGAIVNLSSGRAALGAVNGSHYSASKGGIISLTRSLAAEWAPTIRVNAVMPGVTDTAQPREAGVTDEELYARGERIPLGRIGQPEDIANTVAFLLSDDAKYITGQTIAVNGGAIPR